MTGLPEAPGRMVRTRFRLHLRLTTRRRLIVLAPESRTTLGAYFLLCGIAEVIFLPGIHAVVSAYAASKFGLEGWMESLRVLEEAEWFAIR